MPEIVEKLPAILLEAAAAELRQTGFFPRPQVHMFAEDMASPYIGYIVCRPFYRGEDAATAIAGLGLLPSVMALTRLLVLWEDRDLRTALEMPASADAAMGLSLLDARPDSHTLRWHPFEAELTGVAHHGNYQVRTINPRWREPSRFEDVPLPQPISDLLGLWRELRRDDIRQTAIGLQKAGYEMHWVSHDG
ncbi:hypothetical protein ACIA5G_33490 [Amycolatopsis sp. NPDC051758]|uniref:hypothetical protein n=1 Tax=Amycolatopsis sp. NPDC051758 TaxID=3363935 RepID=UPI0037B596AD